MQGHPEAPRLWEKHADKILRSIGLRPNIHEPCLYSGHISNTRVLLLRQVDDFCIAAPTQSIANHIFDLIDEHLTIPLKRLGLVDLFNSVDILQTKHYVKISCTTYLERICEKYLDSWMHQHHVPARPTPLPATDSFMKSFLAAIGDPTPSHQATLERDMQLKYKNVLGELIYALVTCHPDISFAVVKCAQATTAPHEIHYHALRHILKYLYVTRTDGLYLWRQTPHDALPAAPNSTIMCPPAAILSSNRPQHDPLDLHGYVDSDWASCPKTRRSLTGVGLCLWRNDCVRD
jgi:hypothetical protein